MVHSTHRGTQPNGAFSCAYQVEIRGEKWVLKAGGMNKIRRNIKALVNVVTGRRLPRAVGAALHEAGVVSVAYYSGERAY